jgi:hypothetical protein
LATSDLSAEATEMASLVFNSERGVDECIHRLSSPLPVVWGEELLDRRPGLIRGHDEQERCSPRHELGVA